MRAFGRISLIIALTLSAVACSILYAGGYGENLPILNRISGPMRYEQFVDAPIPSNVHAVRDGYKGFPTGWIETKFSYEGDYARPLLGNWQSVAIHPGFPDQDRGTRILETWGRLVGLEPTLAGNALLYEKYEPDSKEACCFIVLNKEQKIGVLVVPRSCEGIDQC